MCTSVNSDSMTFVYHQQINLPENIISMVLNCNTQQQVLKPAAGIQVSVKKMNIYNWLELAWPHHHLLKTRLVGRIFRPVCSKMR